MNAKQVKAAFLFNMPVSSDDKEHPVRLGYVKEVVYSLSDSGKVRCSGVVQSWDNANEAACRVSCRHIHYIDDSRLKKPPKVEPNNHTEAIKSAFVNTLPVVAVVPNVGTVEGMIKEIIYWRTKKGNIQCSANIIDVTCPQSTVQARIKYIKLKSG